MRWYFWIITQKEIEVDLRKMKRDKSVGLDGACVEMFEQDGKSVVQWLERFLMYDVRKGEYLKIGSIHVFPI